MKKYFLLFLGLFLFSSFTFAQEGVKSVSLGFCNDGTGSLTNKYTIMIEPGQKQDLCIYVENKSSKDVLVKYSFPKALFTKVGNQTCDTSNDFAKFLVDNSNREAIVSGNSALILKETVIAPVGVIGMYYGCLAYQLGEPEAKGMGGVFNLVVRKTAFLNLFVGSEDSISNLVQFAPVTGTVISMNKNIGGHFDENGDFILSFAVKNNGNLTQNVYLSGKIYNPLGFEKPFAVSVKKLLPGDVYNASVNIGIVPSYKGLFSVRNIMTAEPYFEFDVSNISDKHKQPTVIKENGSLFIFSWIYVIIALLIVGLIVKAVMPKKKKIA